MHFVKSGERVEAEAADLGVAGRHPGVVELVEVRDGALRTRRVEGARSLAELGPLTADEVAGVLASVAATVADLHERGVVHGGIDAGHVLVRPDGPPVLCSFGRGGEPADDVAALGRLVSRLLAAGRQEPASRRGAGRRVPKQRRLPPMLAPEAAPVLAGLVSEATADDPISRPTARALAAAVRQRVPTARLPVPPERAPLPLARPVRGRGPKTASPAAPRPAWRAAGLGLAGVLIAVVAGNLVLVAAIAGISNLLVDRGSGPAPSRVGAGPRTVRRAAGPDGAPPAPAHPVPPASTTVPIAVRVWPSEPLDYHGGVLTVDGARFALGVEGDQVVAGDWACTGMRTPALLRPATGEVFAFDGWPTEGRDTVARLVGRVVGASELRAVDADGDGCDELEVARAGAPPVSLEGAG